MKNDSLQKLFDKVDCLDMPTLRIFAKRMWNERASLQNVLNVVREGIVVINEELCINFFNTAASDLIGLSKPQSIGDSFLKYLPNAAKILKEIWKNDCSKDTFSMHEVKVTYPRQIILRTSVVPYFCDQDDEKKFVIIMIDITNDKHKIEKQIENERFSSITLLASGVAHELGNPLNAIALRMQLMQRQILQMKNLQEKQKMQRSIEICLAEVSRLDEIIKNFLQAVRPTVLNLFEVDLKHIILDVKTILLPELRNDNVCIRTKFNGSTKIHGDVNQLKQAFFNVIKNAAEAIDDGGMVSIKSRETKTHIEILISDNGKGIAFEMIDKVFQPFFSTKSIGNGLGMMIVERILREHGANLDIKSTAGVGTTVIMKFKKIVEDVPLIIKQKENFNK